MKKVIFWPLAKITGIFDNLRRYQRLENILLMFETDNVGNIIWANVKICKEFGCLDTAEKNNVFNMVVAEEQDQIRQVFKGLRSGAPIPTEVNYHLQRADGTFFPGILFLDKIIDKNGVFTGILANVVNHASHEEAALELQIAIRELEKINSKYRRSEEELSKNVRELKSLNESKDRLFSILAHDLRSPFMSILGFCDILIDELDTADKDTIRKYAQTVQRSAKGIYNLLENLLAWMQVQMGRSNLSLKPVAVLKEIEAVINLVLPIATKKKVTITVTGGDKIKALADANALKSVIQNLLVNAIKFTAPGGKIGIYLKNNGKEVRISVKDNGVGVENEKMRRLFSPDEFISSTGTAGEKGTGLGLSLCQSLVEGQGGKIWAESKLGRGSQFYFTLKIAR